MNLSKLFQIQAVLDNRIVEEHNLQGVDLLDKKILALQVELGELANELPEVFKFWSNKKNNYEKALKEYVDGLHFILGIGLELELETANIEPSPRYYRDITFAFNQIFNDVSVFGSIEDAERNNILGTDDLKWAYEEVLGGFIRLGELLGFTWEQIEQAYYDKNKINHERQENGY